MTAVPSPTPNTPDLRDLAVQEVEFADSSLPRWQVQQVVDIVMATVRPEYERLVADESRYRQLYHAKIRQEQAVPRDPEKDAAEAQLWKRFQFLVDDARAERDALAAQLAEIREAGIDPDMLRWCGWPDCWRSFNAATGPGEPGWKYSRTPGRTLLCPQHAASGHMPGYDPRPEEGWKVAGTCECGARAEAMPSNGHGIVAWWASHVAVLNGTEAAEKRS